ncbi:uncharacterized protein LOC129750529 [Uranotaenia lowii]|uniref:uncharacterized protein LOC129750529 n=1 Tax=Uranotaenia lowii TaxID=190385 RepID=UPI00247AE73D|nr:uncharacterized protein LOC129750529 [Uranotaenia lowii]
MSLSLYSLFPLNPYYMRSFSFWIQLTSRYFGSIGGHSLTYVNVVTLIYFFFSRYFCCSSTLTGIIRGLTGELKLIEKGYELIRLRMKFEQSSRAGIFYETFEFWKELQDEINAMTRQYRAVLVMFFKISKAVRVAFFISYYFVGSTAALLLLETILVGGLATLAMAVSCVSALILECYWYCRSVDSFNEVNEMIGLNTLETIAKIPHIASRHREYRNVTATLRQIHLIARQGVTISCTDSLIVSTPTVSATVHMIYTAFTFVANVN